MIVEDAVLPDDIEEVLALNNAAVPAVNALDADALRSLCAMGQLRVVRGEGVEGLCLTLQSGAPYESGNYQWFSGQFDRFMYVDRIVVAPTAKGRGIGRALYEDTFARAAALGQPRVCSEVNSDPPNPQSMAFHASLGFEPIHERLNPSEGKTVRMMVRPIG
ncbi:GNAT family N-acetyltransferase [Acuticoccus sp. MNP-M23]|uniref:GNAT family N-acetyltransferase n=1 Tax=Acuticoccus sp. MNP-M23 TaxID=3072793 RepID=UPI0028161AC0|nr:GNAT family N-acetyltransferase [Acuticoccus sp. MNP-M23]WMS40784.1 GNAT family N-acetyltransferase [Acuticoccus sp. MNP-M23]